ncbi:hypothetical protein [Terriglobus roseus]|uniref:Outer membrane protein beta-barrel domain-containing protein n=1 Tax=Terriglobus roseus TaxID=392734 RepID=A0A1G7IB77_9BACT|nr:hypothetical protein [Terriglobus roseus]SDF09756.1 hypothetical protein SAMN05444167_1379 [Terriglobus roseus]
MKLVVSLFAAASLCVAAHAQMHDNSLQVGLRYSATAANAPPGSCGCFILQGGAIEASIPILPHVRAVVEAAGGTVDRVPASTRGLSEITLLAGPRYTVPIHRIRINAQALFGAVRGFDSDFIVATNTHTDTSTNLAMAIGGSIDLPLSHAVLLRPVQIDYLQTNLPNGIDDRQRNIRFGAGVVFRIHLPNNRR